MWVLAYQDIIDGTAGLVTDQTGSAGKSTNPSHWVPIAIGLFIQILPNSLDDRAHHGLQYSHHVKVPVMLVKQNFFQLLTSSRAKYWA